MNKQRLGCIGLGNMGAHIARNLVKADFDVTVFDVRPAACEPLRSLGARVASSPADLATNVDVLTVTVLDDVQVNDVLLGRRGALASMRAGSVIVIHSTVSPKTCQEVAAAAAVRSVAVVDAPISGGEGAARSGTLTLMIGGSDAAVASCAPVLEAVSEARFHVGDVGAGQAAKLVNNLMGVVNRIVVGEALYLARSAGLHEDIVLDLVKSSTGNSWQVEHWRDMQAIAAASTTGAAGMGAMGKKDLGLAMKLAASLDVSLPVTEMAYEHTAALFTENG
jgi:3-hydroxyisobutyrate dehydrogenase-like beta-hydroxyacid dehydrogenase